MRAFRSLNRSAPVHRPWVRFCVMPAANTAGASVPQRPPVPREKRALADVPLTFKQGKVEYAWQAATAAAPESANGSGGGGGAVLASATAPGQSAASAPDVYIPFVTKSESMNDVMRTMGMPRGFPHTVAPGYARFFYITVGTSFMSNFAMAIATQKLLVGFFSDSTPAIWMLKDLAPSLFAAFIANFVASYEMRPKFWLVVSAMLTQCAVVADLYIPTFVAPSHYLLAAVVTSVIKQSAVLMYFVSRASVIQHFSINQNLGEITKKFNSIGMISYTLATASGIAFTTVCPSLTVQTAVVLSCGLTTIFTSYLATKHIAFRVLNRLSIQLIVRWFVRSGFSSVPLPQQVAEVVGTYGKLKAVVTEIERQKKVGVMAAIAASVTSRLGGSASHLDRLQDASHPETAGSDVHSSPFSAEEQCHMLETIVAINPPVEAMYITKRNLAEALAVTGLNSKFTLGLWRVNTRYGERSLSSRAMRLLSRSARRALFGQSISQRKLVVLVHRECDLRQLLVGLMIAYTAIIKHGTDFAALERFIRDAMRAHRLWAQRADLLMLHLKARGWETSTHQIDMIEHRVSFGSTDSATPISSVGSSGSGSMTVDDSVDASAATAVVSAEELDEVDGDDDDVAEVAPPPIPKTNAGDTTKK